MKFKDIKKLIGFGHYRVDGNWDDINRYIERYNLQLEPDFQRGHVWTITQQIEFCEFFLRGGLCPPILLNMPGWQDDWKGDFVVVDGLQRLNALKQLIENKIKVFGHFLKDIEGGENYVEWYATFPIFINNLQTKNDVIRWYLQINGGGTPHTIEELERVECLMD